MPMKKVLLLILFFNFSFTQNYSIEKAAMRFLAVAKTVGIESDLVGQGNGLTGQLNLTEKRFSFVYDLWEMDTGIELRNDHMHENYLETEDYPEAKFSGTVISFEGNKITVRGVFSLHGVDKEIEVQGNIENSILTAKWVLNLRDYNIEIPKKFLVAKLDENLAMEIKCTLVAQDE